MWAAPHTAGRRRHKRFISHVARRWARGTITSLIPALKRFNASTVRRACVVVVPGAQRTCGLGIARAVVATLPAVAAAVCRHSGGRCGATARCSRQARSIQWPWKFQPLSTGGGTQVARHRTVSLQPTFLKPRHPCWANPVYTIKYRK